MYFASGGSYILERILTQENSLRDIVLVIDISPSMSKSYQDLKPSKLESVKETLAYVIKSSLANKEGLRLGVVAFYGIAFPLLSPTNDPRTLIRTLSLLDIGGPGSAPGSGIVEAVKLLRSSRRSKEVMLVTDGGFNEGIRLDIAAVYAKNSNVKVNIIAIGNVDKNDEEVIDKAVKLTGGSSVKVHSRNELLVAANNFINV